VLQRPGPAASVAHSRRHAVLAALLLLIAMLAASGPASAAADEPKPLSSRRIFDQSRPGVALIMVEFKASLNVPDPVVTDANDRILEGIVSERVRRGEIPATPTAVRAAKIEEISKDPFRWMSADTHEHRANLKLTATGSGFSISPDGYVVTNAHVVAPNDETLKAAFLAQLIGDDGEDFISSSSQAGLTPTQARNFLNAIIRWSVKNSTLGNFQRKINVVASSGSGDTSPSKKRAAKLIDAGEEFPGKDVAVIKVDGRNMATVPLGDDSALNTGDRLFVLGYPGPATFNPDFSKDSQGEPTLTQGVLSAKKQVKGGYTVLQTDAGMTHGNSGGPVFDEQGKVVGVATFGSVDSNTGREVSGLNFAVPASIVKDLLGKAKVAAQEGTAARTYREALDDYDKQWYKRGLPLLERVRTLDPGHPLVAKLISDSRSAIAAGRDRTPKEILGVPLLYAAAGAGVVVLVLLVLLMVMLVRRRRRKRGRGAAPAGAWPGQPGQPGQPGGWDTRPAGGWPTQPADAQGRAQNSAWVPAPAAAAGGTQAEPPWLAQAERPRDARQRQEPAWDTRQEAAWNDQQQGAWNGGRQQPAWNGEQQASWNDHPQQAAWNDQHHQQSAWNGQQQPAWNVPQQQSAWNDQHQQQSAWSDPPRETWSAQEQGAWDAQEQGAWDAQEQGAWDAQEQPAWDGGETAAGWDGAPESPANAFDYGYGEGAREPDSRNGHNGSYLQDGSAGGESSPPADAQPASEALGSWWDGEEAQTAELPTVRRAQQGQSAQGAYNQCGNCGVRNHPSLRYCEQCWTVLVP
jgi:serine protease Do